MLGAHFITVDRGKNIQVHYAELTVLSRGNLVMLSSQYNIPVELDLLFQPYAFALLRVLIIKVS